MYDDTIYFIDTIVRNALTKSIRHGDWSFYMRIYPKIRDDCTAEISHGYALSSTMDSQFPVWGKKSILEWAYREYARCKDKDHL